MNDAEIHDASNALRQWFNSQDIPPPDAGCVMVHLMASLMVQKTTSVSELQFAVKSFNLALTCEIALKLKALT